MGFMIIFFLWLVGGWALALISLQMSPWAGITLFMLWGLSWIVTMSVAASRRRLARKGREPKG